MKKVIKAADQGQKGRNVSLVHLLLELLPLGLLVLLLNRRLSGLVASLVGVGLAVAAGGVLGLTAAAVLLRNTFNN